jgi:hypothetical protein
MSWPLSGALANILEKWVLHAASTRRCALKDSPGGKNRVTYKFILTRIQCVRIRDGSGMFIPDPDFYPSRIPDPKTATKERGEKKFAVIYLFM